MAVAVESVGAQRRKRPKSRKRSERVASSELPAGWPERVFLFEKLLFLILGSKGPFPVLLCAWWLSTQGGGDRQLRNGLVFPTLAAIGGTLALRLVGDPLTGLDIDLTTRALLTDRSYADSALGLVVALFLWLRFAPQLCNKPPNWSGVRKVLLLHSVRLGRLAHSVCGNGCWVTAERRYLESAGRMVTLSGALSGYLERG